MRRWIMVVGALSLLVLNLQVPDWARGDVEPRQQSCHDTNTC